ncbi:MAG TPA: hypothetical protein VGG63_07345 [Steroidobacteraceae bacterium]
MTEAHDPTLDVLLDLDGQLLVVDPEGGYWCEVRGHAGAINAE